MLWLGTLRKFTTCLPGVKVGGWKPIIIQSSPFEKTRSELRLSEKSSDSNSCDIKQALPEMNVQHVASFFEPDMDIVHKSF